MPIELDKKALKKAREYLSGIKGGYEKAVSRSINRAVQSTGMFITRQVTEDYTLKAKYVKADARITKSSANSLFGQIYYSGIRQSEAHFKVTPAQDTTRTHKPVKVEERRGSGRILKRAFVWEGDKVMQRISEAHAPNEPTKAADRNLRGLPVEKLTGPSVEQIAGQDDRMHRAEEHLQKTFEQRLEHETEALLMGWSKK